MRLTRQNKFVEMPWMIRCKGSRDFVPRMHSEDMGTLNPERVEKTRNASGYRRHRSRNRQSMGVSQPRQVWRDYMKMGCEQRNKPFEEAITAGCFPKQD